MLSKDKFKNTFYTSLVLLFTLSSLFKSDYCAFIPVDFGGYSSDTKISLVMIPKTDTSVPVIRFNNDTSELFVSSSQPVRFTNIYRLFKIKLNRYIFPQIISSKYLHPDFDQSIQILSKFNTIHQSPDDEDSLVS